MTAREDKHNAKDPGGDAVANEGPVDDKDEIGLIFYKDVSSTIFVNLDVITNTSEGKTKENDDEAGNADEEDENKEDGQVEDINDVMSEKGDRYLPAPPIWKLKGWRKIQMKDKSYYWGKILRRRVKRYGFMPVKRVKMKSPTMRVKRKVLYLQHQIHQINQRE
jgi:hypothetical protein